MISKAKIKLIQSLKRKKYREKHKLFVVEGEKSIKDLLQAGMKAVDFFVVPELMEYAVFSDFKPEEISKEEMKKISFLSTPGNLLAVFEIPEYSLDESFRFDFILALDDVQDPGNLGTIIRVADWFGIKAIVCSNNTADVFNPKVVQATMGSIARVQVHYVDLSDFLKKAKNEYMIYGSFMEGDSVYETDFSKKKILIMGNEGKGISTEIEKFIAQKVSIPLFAKGNSVPESLNVAMATGIILSEIKRKEKV